MSKYRFTILGDEAPINLSCCCPCAQGPNCLLHVIDWRASIFISTRLYL